jgi:F-type H+-transporting ATPase subunit b
MAVSKKNAVIGTKAPYWRNAVIGFILIAVGMVLKKNDVQISIIEFNFGVTVATIGVLLVVLPAIDAFYIKPFQNAINERNSALEHTFSEAENLRTEMRQLKTEYEARLVETEARAREQIQQQIREAQELRTRLMAEATEKAEELMRRAHEEISSERDHVLTQIRVDVVNLALSATERILGENVDDARNRKLVEEFIDKVEVPNS